MSISIVIARYNECVKWSEQVPNVIIYNKGNELGECYNEILLNNVGREGHTYYKYICDNYENLSDYTIFLQGNPFDHSPHVLYNINKYINNKELNIDFEYLSEMIIRSTLDAENHKYPTCCTKIHSTWERIFGEKSHINQECIYGAGAQFIVSKNTILNHTKEFYENIVKILEYNKTPLEGFDVERFHKYIFATNKPRTCTCDEGVVFDDVVGAAYCHLCPVGISLVREKMQCLKRDKHFYRNIKSKWEI
tara:strand:+ start:26718 stop:27467 length:750 start_codon:yes stop_codon:yes gene_type:complete